MVEILGTCSICGGEVTCPTIWHGIYPPTPTCRSCEATKAKHGPVIDMVPARRFGDKEGTFQLPFDEGQEARGRALAFLSTLGSKNVG